MVIKYQICVIHLNNKNVKIENFLIYLILLLILVMEKLIKKLDINPELNENIFEQLSITDIDDEDDYIFYQDEWAVFTKPKFTKILNMKFIQLWCIFKTPITNLKAGSCEWRIRGKNNDIYNIKSIEAGKSLLERQNWIITSNTDNKRIITKFINHFGEALKIYNKYYKGIEIGNFYSEDSLVQEIMNNLKDELFTNSTYFNTQF